MFMMGDSIIKWNFLVEGEDSSSFSHPAYPVHPVDSIPNLLQ
jgi:hypothetical protein